MDADEVDATRRTRLANERTFLAWLRGGLTGIAVALGVGALVPKLSDGAEWPFVVLGAGFGILAILFIGYGLHRFREVERALEKGHFAPLTVRAATAISALGVTLALLTIVAIAVEH